MSVTDIRGRKVEECSIRILWSYHDVVTVVGYV